MIKIIIDKKRLLDIILPGLSNQYKQEEHNKEQVKKPLPPTPAELVNLLNDKLKVRLALYFIREWEFDETRSFIWDKQTNVFYLKYIDSPLPYSITTDLIASLVNKKFNKYL